MSSTSPTTWTHTVNHEQTCAPYKCNVLGMEERDSHPGASTKERGPAYAVCKQSAPRHTSVRHMIPAHLLSQLKSWQNSSSRLSTELFLHPRTSCSHTFDKSCWTLHKQSYSVVVGPNKQSPLTGTSFHDGRNYATATGYASTIWQRRNSRTSKGLCFWKHWYLFPRT